MSIQLGQFRWLHIFNPFRRCNWRLTWRPGCKQLGPILYEY